jgi:hypothetical protein
MREITYCSYEGRPTVYVNNSGGIAWWFYDGLWKEAPGPEVAVNAPVIGKAEFDRRFGQLPPLPTTDFDGA